MGMEETWEEDVQMEGGEEFMHNECVATVQLGMSF
ncbi:hypothetical protein AZE42_13709 [Rhizopogon vesiculosus]|uniref:Uncharacterized protein n=1 Tax=Rhizopogon vesiculosus TaxID=180088 RepID=A0A1J8RAW2_9AGAM|nr:hypothetical protein AZE42_13709 [Rhizopogon vesiculosus]